MSESTPGRYRKRPVEVTAIRWTGGNLLDVEDLAELHRPDRKVGPVTIRDASLPDTLKLWIEKSQTWGTVSLGDWVIAERDGVGCYPCTAEQFADTYDPAD